MPAPVVPRHPSPRITASTKSYRSRAQTRFSAFFHGYSVITRERYPPAINPSKTQRPGGSPATASRANLRRDGPVSRSRTSTRSLIDPISSPIASPGSPQSDQRWPDRGALFLPIRRATSEQETTISAQETENARPRGFATFRSQRKSTSSKTKVERRCFPLTKDKAIRQKVIGSLVSGSLLVLILTIYLALAISNSVAGQTFHVILILLTLILTILFCHFLIRLCMLTLRARLHRRTGAERVPSRAAEDGYAQPERPIRVILARDEELGLHDNDDGDDGGGSGGGRNGGSAVQFPPPAYGLWRSSVRADPNLIHWQRIDRSMRLGKAVPGETPDLAQHPAYRPPSYGDPERGPVAL